MSIRIVSLLPSSTEIICKLGFSDHLIGISHECDYPNSVVGLPVITKPRFPIQVSSLEIDKNVKDLLKKGLSVYEIDESMLKKLSPDLIVTQAQCEACAVSLNEVQEIVSTWTQKQTKILSLEPKNLKDVWLDFERVAKAMNVPEAATKISLEILERLEMIKDKLKRIKQKPTVLCIEWIDPIMVAANWVPELVSIAGGINLLGEIGSHSQEYSWEDVLNGALKSQLRYHVMKENGTERPFTGEYDKHYNDGIYNCADCGKKLFSSKSKFDSGCGWPAFSMEIEDADITQLEDRSYGMTRIEVRCSGCDSHLGHLFHEAKGPRYCINSICLDFEGE